MATVVLFIPVSVSLDNVTDRMSIQQLDIVANWFAGEGTFAAEVSGGGHQ